MGFGEGGFDEGEPIGIWFFSAFVGDDFNDLAILDVIVEGDHFGIGFGADHTVADFTVNGVGEVDRRRFFGELDDIAVWSESENMIFEEVNLDSFEKLPIVLTDFFLPFLELFDPREFLGRRGFVSAEEKLAPAGTALFLRVRPVSGDTELGFIMHFLRPDLNFDDASFGSEDGRMERLVVVGFGEGNVILDATNEGAITLVDGAKRLVAIGDRRNNDPDGDQIVDTLDVHIVALQFLIQAVESFGAPLDMREADAFFGEAFPNGRDRSVEIGIAFAHIFFDDAERFFV